ncbi:hypothetical protein POKO110462_16920 [Pontibacter korlensis]|uniref:hypothetical protein n=1 Tax=Pontibacter korlensis TaxID=400092 RepID=UPI000A72925E|nr:hypothetical protein [Pontibacter korlensis]
MRTYEMLSNNRRGLIRALLLMLSVVLILLNLSNTYWIGLVHGALLTLIINEILLFWRARKLKATILEPNTQS